MYTATKILFASSVSALISTVLIKQTSGLLNSLITYLSNSKLEFCVPFSPTGMLLAILPLILSTFVFGSVFSYPIIQGLCSSFISAWIIVHTKISEWSYTGIWGLFVDKVGIILSLIFLVRPKILIDIKSILSYYFNFI